jgi:hypothetical protein
MHRQLRVPILASLVSITLSLGVASVALGQEIKPKGKQNACQSIAAVEERLGCREITIAIATTYLESLLVEGAPGVLLHPDVQRWINQNYNLDPPRLDGIEEVLPSVEEENLGEDYGATFENRRWTVEGDEAIVIYDIHIPYFEKPVIVRERFLIEDGLIREIEALTFNPNL